MPRLSDPALLHPTFRKMVLGLQDELVSRKLPMRIYETGRSPWRQSELYALGRSVGERGKTVTGSQAWESFHQYGLAVDFVFHVNGKWSWVEPRKGAWEEFTKAAQQLGLQTLKRERPHVQFPARLADLQFGRLPANGDDTWLDWVEKQVEGWGSGVRSVGGITHPGAPIEILRLNCRPPELDIA
jgi:peptidoglycan L-alanyl-D-glutamate endopeptidase CwlK